MPDKLLKAVAVGAVLLLCAGAPSGRGSTDGKAGVETGATTSGREGPANASTADTPVAARGAETPDATASKSFVAAEGAPLRFAVFTDPHFGVEHRTALTTSPHMGAMAEDVMSAVPRLDFVLGLGDDVHDRTSYVHGVGMPAGILPHIPRWKPSFISRLNVPYMLNTGDHDVVDYADYGAGTPNPMPYRLLRTLMDESEVTVPTYAMLRSNILFLVVGDKGPVTKIHESQKAWLEYMTSRHPEKTTIICSHAAIRGTTAQSNRSHWGFRHSEMWWWKLFERNPQIEMYLHGDGHAMSYVRLDDNKREGYSGSNGSWGHEIAFVQPPSQVTGRDDRNRNQFTIFEIDEERIQFRTWRNEGAGGAWADDFSHRIGLDTSYDEDAEDWYAFPLFLQDGETQVVDNDVVPIGGASVELVGIESYSLFNNPHIDAGVTRNRQRVSGFDGDDSGVAFRHTAAEASMAVTSDGSKLLTFPSKRSLRNNEKGGKSGQLKNYFQHGSTAQAIPAATYEVGIEAKAASGAGRITVHLSTADWGSRTQHSTLAGSRRKVLSGTVGARYRKLTGTYTAPDDEAVWFLQGEISFADATDYEVTSFTIHRKTDGPATADFAVDLNGVKYRRDGPLAKNAFERIDFDASKLTDAEGQIVATASIAGNRVGMAVLYHHAPYLFGRNARFRVNSVVGGTSSITLTERVATAATRFKLMPYSRKYDVFEVEGATVKTSGNGTQWADVEYARGTELRVTLSSGRRAAGAGP